MLSWSLSILSCVIRYSSDSMCECLQDWDVLYLNSIFSHKGAQVSRHLVTIRWTVSAIGYIPTPAFARKVLAAARSPEYNTWVDLLFEVSFVAAMEGLLLSTWLGLQCCASTVGRGCITCTRGS